LAENKRRLQSRRNQGGAGRASRVATLRELQGEERHGNDAPWKAWKTQKPKSEFPTLSTRLGNPAKTKAPDFHISTAPAAGLSHSERTKHEAQTKFQLTDPSPFKHYNCASVASLRP